MDMATSSTQWRAVSVKDIGTVKGGKRLPKGHKLTTSRTANPYIRVCDLINMSVNQDKIKYLEPKSYEKISRYTISSKDVYISIAGTIGLAGVVPEELENANLTENAAKICNLKEINNRYLAYSLTSDYCQKQIRAFTGKATQPKLALFRIEKIKILLPPLEEQRGIVEALSNIDQAIHKVDIAIEKTERIKQGLMQKLFCLKQSEFDWHKASIKDLGKVFTGKTPSTKKKEFWNGEIPFVTPSDISSDSLYIEKTERFITEEGAKQATIIPKDSVMVTCIASIGEVAISVTNCITNQQINSIVCNRDTNPLFVYYLIQYNKATLRRHAGITTSPIIKKSAFEKFPVYMPQRTSQDKIANILYSFDQKKLLEKQKKEKLQRIKQGLMNELLTGKKRIKV